MAKPAEDSFEDVGRPETILPPQTSAHGRPGRLLRITPDLAETEGVMRDLLEQRHKEIMQRFDSQDELLQTALRLVMPTAMPIQPVNPFSSIDESDGPIGPGLPAVAVAPKQRRPSFTPLRFQTFEEEEAARREAALEETKNRGVSESIDVGHRDRFLKRLVNNNRFEMFFTCVVLTNSVFIGIEVELSMRRHGDTPVIILVIQYLYTALFTLELLLRLGALGKKFFCNQDWLWNWLDVFIVTTSLWEVGTDIVQGILGLAGDVGGLEGMTGLKAFRIIRITRIAKTVRLLHIFRFILALRMLITSILNTLKSLLWALILLILIVYVFAVLFTQAVDAHLSGAAGSGVSEEEVLKRYYGSLTKTMLSLFMSIAGGISWQELVFPLETISNAWVLLFLFYISFTYFAVLNVVTAVFCQSAIEGAQNDHAAKVQSVLADKQAHLEKVRALFSQFGADDGVITFGVFQDKINCPAVKEYFTTLGLDVWDAWSFFKLLDLDGGGAVEIEEFLMGCLRLRGQATAMDVAKLMNDVTWLIKSQGKFHTYVEVELKNLKDEIRDRPGAKEPQVKEPRELKDPRDPRDPQDFRQV